ncbi:MAG: SIMPL domain-containing protein, partial [Nitrososphaera sp.]
RNLSPYYSGGGVPASNDVTFNVYASVAIQTDIDHLSDLVSALAQAGFGFESVYIDPVYYSRLAQVAASTDAKGSVESGENVTDGVKNPITIGVSLNTKPDVLTSAIAEYEAKYRTLLSILEEQDISEDQIKQNNFNIYPQYYGSSQTATYQANTQIIVKTGVDNIQTVSSAIRQVDGVFVENVIISVSDEAIDNARQDLTQQAIANAQQRASEMVEPLGLEVKGIKSIEAVGSQGQNPYGGDVFYRGVKILQPYYYQSINGDISVSVMVEFEIGEETSED